MSDEDLPPLQDFESELKTIKITKPQASKSEQDYTKQNTQHIEDKQKHQQAIKNARQDAAKIDQKIQQKQKQKQKQQGYGGLKKGFFSSGGNSKKQQKIPEVKVNKNADPLRIPEVQQAMKMNNYLEDTRKEWMTENFLNNVTTNEKISKLFTNPEYMKAIDLFKTNPREAMARYGGNKEFMDGFQEFCKMMGMQFQNLAQKEKASK